MTDTNRVSAEAIVELEKLVAFIRSKGGWAEVNPTGGASGSQQCSLNASMPWGIDGKANYLMHIVCVANSSGALQISAGLEEHRNIVRDPNARDEAQAVRVLVLDEIGRASCGLNRAGGGELTLLEEDRVFWTLRLRSFTQGRLPRAARNYRGSPASK